MSWKESISCHKFDSPISIPEQDRVRMSVLQKPFEEVIYNRMLRLSFENSRNYCRISYSGIQETTSLRSKNAVITGIQGLIEKRHIIKLINEEGKPEMNREGTLYRVLSPQEALRGVLDDGMVVSEIDRDGMNFTVTVKKLHDTVLAAVQSTLEDKREGVYIRQGDREAATNNPRIRSILMPFAAFALGLLIAFSGFAANTYLKNHRVIRPLFIEKLRSTKTVANPGRSKLNKLDRIRQDAHEKLLISQDEVYRSADIATNTVSYQKQDTNANYTSDLSDEGGNNISSSNMDKSSLTLNPVEASADSLSLSSSAAAQNTLKPIQKQENNLKNPSQKSAKAATPLSNKNSKQSGNQPTDLKKNTKKPVTKPVIKPVDAGAPPAITNPLQEKPLTIIE
jgi:hypothetical protein